MSQFTMRRTHFEGLKKEMKSGKSLCSLLLMGWIAFDLSNSGADAHSFNAGDPDKYVEYVRQEIRQNWEPLQFGKDAEATVQMKIYATGRIAEIKLTESTGNAQADSSCLDAVYELDPLQPMENFGLMDNELTTFYIFKDPDESKDHHCDKKNTSKNGLLLFHAIPINVFYRYPETFKMDELHETGNLRLYEPLHASQYQLGLKQEWATFFRYHPHASRKDLLKQRDWLDQKFRMEKVGEGPKASTP
jgi:hypothetical protein